MVFILRKQVILCAILLFCLAANAANVTLYLFYSTTCPHCHAEQDFLQTIGSQYPSLEIKKYAVDTSQDNVTLMNRFAKAFSVPSTFGVPQTYIGNTMVTGYWDYNTHGKLIQSLIDNCTRTGCPDSFAIVQESESGKAVNTTVLKMIQLNIQSSEWSTSSPYHSQLLWRFL